MAGLVGVAAQEKACQDRRSSDPRLPPGCQADTGHGLRYMTMARWFPAGSCSSFKMSTAHHDMLTTPAFRMHCQQQSLGMVLR